MAEGRFEGRNFLVTGASRGIGAATAELLLEEGARVVGTATSQKGLDSMVSRGIVPVEFEMDGYSNPSDVRSFWAKARGERAFDGVILNAGISGNNGGGLFKDYDLDEIAEIMNVNATIPLMLASLAFADIMRSKGSLVAVTSIVGKTGHAGQVPYAASKGALFPAVASMAMEARRSQIRSAVIGFVDTDMTAGFNEKQVAAFVETTTLERAATATEAGAFILNLASPDAMSEFGEPVPHGGWATFNVKQGLAEL